MANTRPPKIILRFFRWFCHQDLVDSIEGDLMELYQERISIHRKRRADWLFSKDVLLLLRPSIIKPLDGYQNLNQYGMLKNYFKIGWRNIMHSKGFSFINIFGLAAGLTTCALIMLYVVDEMSYDKHFKDGDRIYRIASQVEGEKYVATSAPIAEGIKMQFPEVEQSTRLLRFPGANKLLVTDEKIQKQFYENNCYYVDSTFFQLFSYEFAAGSPATALREPNTIVISQQLAAKLYGAQNPIDNVLTIGLPFGEFNYTIKGVFRNSSKSHIPANIYLSMDNGDVGGWVKNQTNWATNNIFHTYVKLKEGADPTYFESKLDGFLDRNGSEDFKAAGFGKTLFIQPLEDIYLHSNFGYEVAPNGNVKYLYIFASIAAFLLLIACINFMNLSTARSEKRAKEVGLKKVIGAMRGSLISQFLVESLLTSGLALVFVFVLIQLCTPIFNQLTHKELSLFQLPNLYLGLIGLTIVTGFLSGIYPALYLSSFKPISVLKGKLLNNISAVAVRKGLVIFQFTVSTVLVLGAIIIAQQIHFLGNQNLGFDMSHKVVIAIETSEASKNADLLRDELLSNAHVLGTTHASTYPGIENMQGMLFYAEGKSSEETVNVVLTGAGDNYIETLGIELLHGRGFSKEFTDDANALVMNEAAVKQLGYSADNAVGKSVYFEWQDKNYTMNIIGVVRDYHFQSLHQEIRPMALTVSPLFNMPTSFLIANVRSENMADLIATFERSWDKLNPNSPLTFSFLDQDFQKNYEKEVLTSQLVQYFTVIAIVIACLGLFGLSAFSAEQRVKEIGIRKVLGAGVSQIVMLLSTDFLMLVAVSVILALPVAYFAMDKWLQGFAYHIDMEWWVFLLAGLSALCIAFITVSYQAIRAAIANPVMSLKAE